MAAIKWVKVGTEVYDVQDTRVPNVTSAENGKIVSVADGQYVLVPTGGYPEISFILSDVTYTAKAGQTFGEWIWSKYCPIELRVETSLNIKLLGTSTGYTSNKADILNASGKVLSTSNGTAVPANTEIVANGIYKFN